MTTLKLAFISGKVRNFVAFSLSVLVALLLTSCKDKQDTYSYQLHKLNLTAKKTNMPAYISKIVRSPNSSLFIIGDFVNLFLFDYNVNLLKRIKVLYGGTFTPTDTDFDPSTKTLYIANYRGNNVLVGILDLDSPSGESRLGVG